MSPRLHASARKHFERDRLTDEAVLYAYEHALNSRPLDDEDDPRRWLVVGIDQSGRVLEMVVLVFDGGGELLIHAMKASSCRAALIWRGLCPWANQQSRGGEGPYNGPTGASSGGV